jgi:hypothetical protein
MIWALLNTTPLSDCMERSRSSEDDSRRPGTFDSHILCVKRECLILFFHDIFTVYILSQLHPVHSNITLPNAVVERRAPLLLNREVSSLNLGVEVGCSDC